MAEYTIKLDKDSQNIQLKKVSRNVTIALKKRATTINLQQVGRKGQKGDKGDPGDPATNLVTSVNGNQGAVVLDASDVGADIAGAAAQALSDANDYTDNSISGIDTGVLSVQAGTNVSVDNTDPANPVVNSTGGGAVDSVNGQTGTVVLDADDIDDTSTTNKFVTSTDLTKLSNLSGTNTGDQNASQVAYDDTVLSNYGVTGDDTQEVVDNFGIAMGNIVTNLSAIKQNILAEGAFVDGDKTKLDGIETNADVTDATNVAAAGAVMEADTSTASMSFVIDEDNMASDSATKVPTQQSVKAYVDANAGGSPAYKWISPAELGYMSGMLPSLNALGANQLVYIQINAGNHRRSSLPLAPIGWNTMDVEIYWSTPTTDAGTIILSLDVQEFTVGSGASQSGNAKTFNATGTAGVLNKDTWVTDIPAMSEMGAYQIRYSASSSYPGNVYVHGIKYIRKT